MRNNLLVVRQGFIRPRPRVRFYDELGAIFDLTGSTVTFDLADRDRRLIWAGHAALIIDPPTGGYAEYPWATGETDLEPSDYLGIFVAHPPDGDDVPLPVGDEIVIRVHQGFVA